MKKKPTAFVLMLLLSFGLTQQPGLSAADAASAADENVSPPTKAETLEALKKATKFYVTRVATAAGYQGSYTESLAADVTSMVGRGPETVTSATPSVGMAFLEAWEATGEHEFLAAARSAAHGMLQAQMCSGGWDERVTELDPVKRKDYRFRADGDCPETEAWVAEKYKPDQTGDKQVDPRRNMTNMDNNITQSVVRMLMRVDQALEFKDQKIHDGVRHALDYLILAQYAIGAWPRNYEKLGDPARFPVLPASYPATWSRTWTRPLFYSYYVMNDDCTLNVMDAMFEAARIYDEPRYKAAAEKAGVFILLAQMPEPQPAWAQQYDPQMQPSWARSMEPPAISGRESVSILQALLTLYRETGKRKYLDPIPKAVEYLKKCSFERNGKRVIARFYELKTNRPLYITPGSPSVRKITYSPDKLKRGYTFFTSAEPLDQIAEEYKSLVAADPETVRRPDKLRSLKPFTHRPQPPLSKAELTEKVRNAIASLDERGAWTASVPLRAGESFPSQRRISTHTFVNNMKLMSDYFARMK